MHLRDRRGRDRGAVEALEHVVERAAEVELHDPAHDVERLGRHAVAQQLELGDQLLGEEAFAARDDLAELDVGRAERREGVAEPARQPAPPGFLPAALVDQVPAAERDPDPADDAEQPADRRQRAGLQPGRELIAGLRAPAIDVGPPRHRLGLDDPRPVIAERPDREIGGEGRVHP